jgi:CheY-like chemotaxis protein
LAVLKDNRDVDLVVADINMPRMDGLTLLQRLQENEERLSTIIVSAYGDMANIRAAMNRGAFDFLTKPIDFLDLEATIAKTIRHIGVLREARRRQAEAERAHASLSRYFSPNLAERLASDAAAIDLGGQRREIATLFSDIASFTALVETIEPDVLGPLLNDYLTGMTDLVFANDGTVARGSRIDIVVRKCSGASNMPACWGYSTSGWAERPTTAFLRLRSYPKTNNVQKLRALIGNPRLSQQLMGQVPIFCGPKVEKFNSILSL